MRYIEILRFVEKGKAARERAATYAMSNDVIWHVLCCVRTRWQVENVYPAVLIYLLLKTVIKTSDSETELEKEKRRKFISAFSENYEFRIYELVFFG